jgi:hypothetical protein
LLMARICSHLQILFMKENSSPNSILFILCYFLRI